MSNTAPPSSSVGKELGQLAKAVRLLEQEGMTPADWQFIIDNKFVRKRLCEVMIRSRNFRNFELPTFFAQPYQGEFKQTWESKVSTKAARRRVQRMPWAMLRHIIATALTVDEQYFLGMKYGLTMHEPAGTSTIRLYMGIGEGAQSNLLSHIWEKLVNAVESQST